MASDHITITQGASGGGVGTGGAGTNAGVGILFAGAEHDDMWHEPPFPAGTTVAAAAAAAATATRAFPFFMGGAG